MKRIVSLALACVILGFSLVVPANAASTEDNYFSVLDYATANGSGTNQFGSSSTYTATATYDIPFRPYIRYADIVFTSADGDPSSVTINGRSLTLVKISSRLFRAYGSFTVIGSVISLAFTSSTAGVAYNIISFDVGTYSSMCYDETGFFATGGVGWSKSFSYMNNSSSPATQYFESLSNQPLMTSFYAYVYPENFRKYDSMDIYLKLRCRSIDSISVNFDHVSVPFDVSYFSLSTGDWVLYTPNDGNWHVGVYDYNEVFIMLHLDLSSLDRTVGSYPQITITGQYIENNAGQYLSLVSVVGHVTVSPPSPVLTYFYDLKLSLEGWFSSLISSLSGNTSSGDEFKDESDSLISDLGDISASMDAVQRPSMENIDVSFSGDLSEATSVMGALFTVVFSSSWLSTIFMASVTLGLISYILYGKD